MDIDSKDKLKNAENKCISLSEKKGYLTYDDIIKTVDDFDLSFDEIEIVSGYLLNNGIIIIDEPALSDDYIDRARIDYDKIYNEILQLSPDSYMLIEYAKSIIPAQKGEIDSYIIPAQNGNEFAKNRLFEIHYRVVLKESLYLSKRYHLDFEEVVDYASMGLIKAILAYDYYNGQGFSSYVPFWIKQYVFRNCHFFNRLTSYPAHALDNILYIYARKNHHSCDNCPENDEELCPELARSISVHLKQPVDLVQKLYKASLSFESVENLIEQGVDIVACKAIDSEEKFWSYIDEKVIVEEVRDILRKLKGQYIYIIEKRFGFYGEEPATLEEIGRHYNLTRERIRQLEKKAISKLKWYAIRYNLKALLLE